ncbi:hypothetical protein CDD83_795 [Cordyceps sp. RAO-2017]|nr:hypothetical protein CDD83_795 [Cordyceps sp. RAO-2017]
MGGSRYDGRTDGHTYVHSRLHPCGDSNRGSISHDAGAVSCPEPAGSPSLEGASAFRLLPSALSGAHFLLCSPGVVRHMTAPAKTSRSAARQNVATPLVRARVASSDDDVNDDNDSNGRGSPSRSLHARTEGRARFCSSVPALPCPAGQTGPPALPSASPTRDSTPQGTAPSQRAAPVMLLVLGAWQRDKEKGRERESLSSRAAARRSTWQPVHSVGAAPRPGRLRWSDP